MVVDVCVVVVSITVMHFRMHKLLSFLLSHQKLDLKLQLRLERDV